MGSSRTRSQQLSQRPLILPHEVTRMHADEQIILTGDNPPLRCCCAIYFRRPEMAALVGKSNFQPKTEALDPKTAAVPPPFTTSSGASLRRNVGSAFSPLACSAPPWAGWKTGTARDSVSWLPDVGCSRNYSR